MKLLTDKKYYELIIKISEQKKELESLKVEKDLDEQTRIYIGKVNIDLRNEALKLRHKISELEPIVEKFNHKKNLEKARKQKYRSKLRLQKKQPTEPIPSIYKMSRQEKFAMENIGKEVDSGISGIGYVAGYHNKDQYILIGFKDNSGWQDKKTRPECVILKKYKTYWYVQIEKVKFKQ